MNAIRIALSLCLAASLACGFVAGPSSPMPATPRPEDIQPAIAQTQAAGGGVPTSPPPGTSAPATAVTALPTPSAGPPATSPVPPPGEQPPVEAILILEPGVASQVVSLVHVAGLADPTFEQNLVVEIIGDGGTVLARATATIAADVGQRGPFGADVEFTVGADQPGRIVVYSASARDGGTVHLASVEVTLLAAGPPTIQRPGPHPEEREIVEPVPSAAISGGTVHVAGRSGPTFEQDLIIEIHDADGSVVGSSPTTIGSEAGQGGMFSADIAYAVSEEQPGRIVVYDRSARDGGVVHLASVEVTLKP